MLLAKKNHMRINSQPMTYTRFMFCGQYVKGKLSKVEVALHLTKYVLSQKHKRCVGTETNSGYSNFKLWMVIQFLKDIFRFLEKDLKITDLFVLLHSGKETALLKLARLLLPALGLLQQKPLEDLATERMRFCLRLGL